MNTLNRTKEYKVHPDDLDVRGWHLVVDGTNAGVVNDLVLDEDRMSVKYLDVLKRDNSEKTDYHYLIPLDEVIFDKHKKYVRLEKDSHRFFDSYPTFTGSMPRDYEDRVRLYYSDTRSGDPGYYERDFRTTDYEQRDYPEDRSRRDDIHIIEKEERYSDKGKDYSENPEEQLFTLEKQKELRKLEYERDIAILDKEILQIKSRLR
jgi:hypothetical protein